MSQYVSSEAQWRSKLFTTLKESGSSQPLRARMAQQFGTSDDEITLTRNCTDGLATLLFGYDLRAGDEVVTSTEDYDYVIAMLRQRERRDSIRLVLATLPASKDGPLTDKEIVAAFESQIASRTRMLVFCHVYSNSGAGDRPKACD